MLTVHLGPGESGKSTVVKQMRLIHAGGFSKAEKKSWKNVIFHNLVDAFLLCFEILLAHGDHVQDAKSEVGLSHCTTVRSIKSVLTSTV